MTEQWEDGGGGKQGRWRSGHAAANQVPVFLTVEVNWSPVYTHTAHHMYIQFRLVPDLAERNSGTVFTHNTLYTVHGPQIWSKWRQDVPYAYCHIFILLTCTCFNLSNQLFMHWEINTFDTQFPVYRICLFLSAGKSWLHMLKFASCTVHIILSLLVPVFQHVPRTN